MSLMKDTKLHSEPKSKSTRMWQMVIFFIIAPSSSINATQPYFTGSLLSMPGITIARGHSFLVLMATHTQETGWYNHQEHKISIPHNMANQPDILFSVGLTDEIDVQMNVPYVFNQVEEEKSAHHIGDVAIALGYQALRQNHSLLKPNLRVTLQETIPTGRASVLSPTNEGTYGNEGRGYETNLGLNFQHLLALKHNHYLRTRLNLNYIYAQTITIHNFNIYDGKINAHRALKPGNLFAINIAGEFTLNQNWVAAIDANYFQRQATRFSEYLENSQFMAAINDNNKFALTLAPAIEYNFSENYGIIAGCWFPIKGKNTPFFLSSILAFNGYW